MSSGGKRIRKFFVFGLAFLLAIVGFFVCVKAASAAPSADDYAPNLWFSAGEEYFPVDPLEFYYENGQEIYGELALGKYNKLSLQEKLNKLTVLYHIEDEGNELVYEYWLFYVFNDYATGTRNKHYGDWESVFVFVDKNTGKVNKVIGTAHQREVFDTEIYRPSNNHIWTYVGEGSHGNCVDEKNKGCSFSRWKAMEIWDKNSPQILSDQYNLREITPEYIAQFNGETILAKSPVGGINFLGVAGFDETKLAIDSPLRNFFQTGLGGSPPAHAWAQSNYYEPEELRPYSIQMAKEYVLNKANQAKEMALGWLDNLGGLFKDLEQTSGVSAALFTPLEELEKQAESFLAELAPVSAEATPPPVEIARLPETKPAVAVLPLAPELPKAELVAEEPIKEEIKQPEVKKEAAAEGKTDKPAEKKVSYGDGGNSAGGSSGGSAPVASAGTIDDEPATTTDEVVPDGGLGGAATSTDEAATSTEEVDLTPPPAVGDLTAGYGSSRGTIKLSWTAPLGASEYIIRWATSTFASSSWDLASDVLGEPAPPAGGAESFSVDGLTIGQTYYFALKSKDAAGNLSEMSNIASSLPSALADSVVISEVQLYEREFVELYNPTGQTIDLSGWYWSYFSAGRDWNNPYRNKEFPTGASIAAGGYYLIGLNEFDANNGLIEADWLAYSSPQLDNSNGSIGIFSANPALASSSAEARNLAVDALGWGNAQYVFENKLVAAPEQYRSLIRQTAGWDTSDNSADFIVKDWPNPTNSSSESATPVSDKIEIGGETTWDLAGSPYLLESNSNSYPTVLAGAVLTIEPGAIIKGVNKYYPSLLIKGILKAQGTVASPIVFTANTSTPEKGDWSGIIFDGAEDGSVLDYVRFEFGGYESSYNRKTTGEMLRIIDSDTSISHSTFEQSARGAVYLENSNSLISDSVFSQNSLTAVVVSGALSVSTIESCRFEDNDGNGISVLSEAAPIIAENVFSGNFYPVSLRNSYPALSGNEATGNDLNGIVVEQATVFEKDAVWKADSLAYILFSGSNQAPTVATGTALTIEPGAVIKPYSPYYTALKIEGELIAEGVAGAPIVFTSLKDDDYAGDTNNSTTTPTGGDWKDIRFAAGSLGRLSEIVFRYGSKDFLDIDPAAAVVLKEE